MKRGNARSESKDLRRKSSQGEGGRGKEAESLLQARAGGRRAGLDPTAGPGVGECFPASRVTGLGSPSLDFFQSLPCYSQQGHSQTGLPVPRADPHRPAGVELAVSGGQAGARHFTCIVFQKLPSQSP